MPKKSTIKAGAWAALCAHWDPLQHFPTAADRLLSCCRSFLGVPYKNGACGEGPEGQFDRNPLWRWDCHDCLTFVNHVLALFHTGSPLDWPTQLIRINYTTDKPQYADRCHLMLTDWLPNNISQGVIRLFSGIHLPHHVWTVSVDKRAWFSSLSSSLTAQDELRSLGQGCLPQTATLIYHKLPDCVSHYAGLLEDLPPISLMLIVRPSVEADRNWRTISHLGFVYNMGESATFIHAALSDCVREEDLLGYLKRFYDHEEIQGVAFYTLGSPINATCSVMPAGSIG